VIDDLVELPGCVAELVADPPPLVLAPSGAVTYVSIGGLSWDELQRAIEQAQANPSASTHGSGVLQ
jgi:hypothetical protein